MCVIMKLNTEYKGEPHSRGVKAGATETVHMLLKGTAKEWSCKRMRNIWRTGSISMWQERGVHFSKNPPPVLEVMESPCWMLKVLRRGIMLSNSVSKVFLDPMVTAPVHMSVVSLSSKRKVWWKPYPTILEMETKVSQGWQAWVEKKDYGHFIDLIVLVFLLGQNIQEKRPSNGAHGY